jgi:hypothetical protein
VQTTVGLDIGLAVGDFVGIDVGSAVGVFVGDDVGDIVLQKNTAQWTVKIMSK